MYSYQDDDSNLTGVMTGRPESPTLEKEAGRAIEKALKKLIEVKYLYQKQAVDLTPVRKPLQEAIENSLASYLTPSLGGGGPTGLKPLEVTPDRFDELCAEIAERPWILRTRHLGDNVNDRFVSKIVQSGVSKPVNSPIKDMHIGFFLPSVQLQCLGTCKSERTFSGLSTSSGNPYSQPWGLAKGPETEQLFFPIFRCEGCSHFAYTMLVRRRGLKLQLCGITPKRPVVNSEKIPTEIAPILKDADQSVAEGDLFAAFYHLRTLIEHYVKQRLGLPKTEKAKGDDLISRYNETIIEGLKGTLPSLLLSWRFLSEALHAREGSADDFSEQRELVCKHIEVVARLGVTSLAPIA